MFQLLWKIRYVLYGSNNEWESFEPTMQLSSSHFNEWAQDRYNYQYYFYNGEENEDEFLKREVLNIIGFKGSSKRRWIKKLELIAEEILNDEYNSQIEGTLEKSLFHTKWKELIADYENNGSADFPGWQVQANQE